MTCDTFGKSIPLAVTSEEKRMAESAVRNVWEFLVRSAWVSLECISRMRVGSRGWGANILEPLDAAGERRFSKTV
jgi:hypothetical protein